MSRIRTPFSASIISPLLEELSGNLLSAPTIAGLIPNGRSSLFLHTRIQAGDAAALGAGGLIDDGIDERGLARADGLFHRLAQFSRVGGVRPHAAEGLDDLVVARVLHEHRRRRVAARG